MATFQQKLIESELNRPWESPYWNPAVDDPYTNQAVKDRIYQDVLGKMGWEDILKSGFQRPGEENLTPTIYNDIVKRINATGWDEAAKKAAVLKGVTDHYNQFGSGFTEWSTPEGIAGLFGLPDYNRAQHDTQDQTYSAQHAKMAKEADADSFSNAMMIAAAAAGIGGGLAGLYGPITAGAGEAIGGAGIASGDMGLWDVTGNELGAGVGGASTMGAATPSLSFTGNIPNIQDLYKASGGGSMTNSLTSPDWLETFLKESGEFGVDPTTLQSGFNAAASTAPWWSSLPTGAQNLLQSLGKSVPGLAQQLFGTGTGGTGSGSYQFPFGDVLGGLLGAYGAKQKQNDLRSYLDKALTYSDPFHDQRPQYQTQFRNLTQNPSNFFKDPAISSILDLADETTGRKLASQGYNMSGNFANEVAKTRANEMFKNYLPYSDMIGTAAGYKLTPGASGEITSNMGGAIANQGNQIFGNLGAAAESLGTGKQPSYLEQMFGSKPNQNLAQLFMTSF